MESNKIKFRLYEIQQERYLIFSMAFDFVSINSKSAYDVINLKLETESYEAIGVQLQKRMSKSRPAGIIFKIKKHSDPKMFETSI